ncbi:MAG: group II intron reverse transcriptase/maturase [Thermoplasmataceae archaeon]
MRATNGAPGIDNTTMEEFQENISENIDSIINDLMDNKYTPQPARRVWIPKPNGKIRGLGIPTVRDRIVQQAVKIVMEPIFEADFMDVSFGFRPNRSAHDAIDEIVKYLNFGCENVIDADITGCFDNIPRNLLMQKIAARISDGRVLKLIKSFLNAGIMENGNITNPEGTPQGSPLSPLLANIYLNDLDRAWTTGTHSTETHIVRYADDFIILGRGDMTPEMQNLRRIMKSLRLDLNEEKTGITEAENGFDFLGFHFVRHFSSRRNKRVTRWFPSRKSQKAIRQKIKEKTGNRALSTMTPWNAMKEVETTLEG